MIRSFRKYHRTLAIIVFLPLILTALTGMAYIVLGDWFRMGDAASLMLRIHSGDIFGLEKVYPVLNALGLLGMLVTGVSMTGLFRQRRQL